MHGLEPVVGLRCRECGTPMDSERTTECKPDPMGGVIVIPVTVHDCPQCEYYEISG